ncbi:MAG: histidine phosphatase family protein [Candidatus Nanopelagicales bacterium]|jgi:probable phosphoglycerate mutase
MADARLWLIRHGQTAWAAAGRHTGRTDVPLTDEGQRQAADLRPVVERTLPGSPGLVLCSPLSRARDTARLAGLVAQEDADLLEWDYGAWEGRTTPEIRQETGDPRWLVWDHPVPPGATPGEQVADVGTRVDRVLARCAPVLAGGADVVLVAHAHVLRILTARWLALPPVDGRLFALEPATLSSLGFEHDCPVVRSWNVRP